MSGQIFLSLFAVVDLAAVAVFAITGALVASRKPLDIVGFLWLGTITGIGGGTARDLLLGVPVFWIREPLYVITSVVVSVGVYFTAHLVHSRYRVLLVLDAIGLAMVTIVGTSKGLDAGVGSVNAIVMGVITASLGGIIRDILGQEASIILKREIYVSAALAGALVFVALIGLGLERWMAALAGFSVALVLRLLAMAFGWAMPSYHSHAEAPHED